MSGGAFQATLSGWFSASTTDGELKRLFYFSNTLVATNWSTETWIVCNSFK